MTSNQDLAAPTAYVPATRMYVKIGLAMLVSAGLCGYVAATGSPPSAVPCAMLAAINVVLLVRMLVRMSLRKPMVVLDARGVTFGYTDFVAWDLIASVSVRHRVAGDGRSRFEGIAFEVRDLDAYLAAVGRTARWNARTWLKQGHSPLRMTASCFPVPTEDVVAAMRRHHPELLVAP